MINNNNLLIILFQIAQVVLIMAVKNQVPDKTNN